MQLPENLSQVLTMNRKIINGTEFLPKKASDQIALCPRENSEERCFESKIFGTDEPLRCASKAKAILQPKFAKCSDDNVTRYFTPYYEVSSFY